MIPAGGPQHVWVTHKTWIGDEQQRAGLLLEQRQRADGSWECWVIFAGTGHPEGNGPQVRQEWVPAERVQRA